MDIDALVRIAAVCLAGILIVSMIDLKYIVSKIKSYFVWPFPEKEIKVVSEEVEFLEIVDLWHKLKASCSQYGLKEATEKLDEVFPLLNVEE